MKLIDISQLSEMINVKKKTIYDWLHKGMIPYFKLGQLIRLNPDDIEKNISQNTKVIIINSPMNPTGSVMTKKELSRVAELSEQHNLYVLTDEIYSKMTYDRDFFSPSVYDEAKERTIILDGGG